MNFGMKDILPSSLYMALNQIFFSKMNQINLKPEIFCCWEKREGRNAVYAAGQGWKVDAVDFSTIAKEKALKLAYENNVKIMQIKGF